MRNAKQNQQAANALHEMLGDSPPAVYRPTSQHLHYHASSQPYYAPRTQTIEKTAKTWKAQMLLSFGVFVVGIGIVALAVMGAVPGVFALIGVLMILVGFAWFVTARIGAWWYHG